MVKTIRAPMTISIDCPCCNQRLHMSTQPGGLYSAELPDQKSYWRDGAYFLECRHCLYEICMGVRVYAPISHGNGAVVRAR
jgi:hypothetical protein